MRSEMVSTVAKLPSASCSGSSSTTGGGGTWVRIEGALGTETRGRSLRDGLARPARPSRWTLPITALRVTPPRARAIWLAERPSVHKFLSCSTRSSDQFACVMALLLVAGRVHFNPPVTKYSSPAFVSHKLCGTVTSPCPNELGELCCWQTQD